MDCMQGMKEFPDKYFDLAIIDPPYGMGERNTVEEIEADMSDRKTEVKYS